MSDEDAAHHFHSGIEWPLRDAESGKPTTTPTNKSVWIAALEALLDSGSCGDDDDDDGIDAAVATRTKDLIKRFKSQTNREWRHGYIPLVHDFGRIMASCGSKGALVMARAGLDRLNSSMVVTKGGDVGVVAGGTEEEGSEPMTAARAVLEDGAVPLRSISTVTFEGGGDECGGGDLEPSSGARYVLASPHRDGATGEHLAAIGDDMKAQLTAWADYGCIEPSAAHSAGKVADLEDCSSLVEGKAFVLLGATSAMGPAEVLVRMGATVAAVARPGAKLEALVELARKKGPRGMKLLVPKLEGNGGRPGGDLIRDAPELARWVAGLCPEKRLVICNLAYLDGEKNVRASVGMDLITEYVCRTRANTALSYIISPGTVHVVTDEAAFDAKKRFDNAPFWHSLCGVQASNTWREVIPPDNLRLLNGLASIQGPNYALTKTAQQWRAMVSYYPNGSACGHIVSANHGPPTRTESMVGHEKVAVALEGMQHFPPNVAFDVSCAKTLLAALMLYDVNFSESAANPESESKPRHPMCLFNENSAHGGAWRCPWELNSISTASFLSGKMAFKKSGWCPEGAMGPKPKVEKSFF